MLLRNEQNRRRRGSRRGHSGKTDGEKEHKKVFTLRPNSSFFSLAPQAILLAANWRWPLNSLSPFSSPENSVISFQLSASFPYLDRSVFLHQERDWPMPTGGCTSSSSSLVLLQPNISLFFAIVLGLSWPSSSSLSSPRRNEEESRRETVEWRSGNSGKVFPPLYFHSLFFFSSRRKKCPRLRRQKEDFFFHEWVSDECWEAPSSIGQDKSSQSVVDGEREKLLSSLTAAAFSFFPSLFNLLRRSFSVVLGGDDEEEEGGEREKKAAVFGMERWIRTSYILFFRSPLLSRPSSKESFQFRLWCWAWDRDEGDDIMEKVTPDPVVPARKNGEVDVGLFSSFLSFYLLLFSSSGQKEKKLEEEDDPAKKREKGVIKRNYLFRTFCINSSGLKRKGGRKKRRRKRNKSCHRRLVPGSEEIKKEKRKLEKKEEKRRSISDLISLFLLLLKRKKTLWLSN